MQKPVRPASIRDVASAAGVSIASVSRALNADAGKVSEATRQRVLRAAEVLGYAPNHMGRSLRAQRSNTYAFLLSNIQNNLFSAIAWEMERLIAARGAGMLLYTTNEDPETQDRCIEDARSRQVAGLFFLCAVESARLPAAAASKRCLFINRRIPALADVPFVGIDDRAAARELMASCLRRTEGPVAVVHGPLASDTSRRRLEGFEKSARDLGRPLRPEHVLGSGLSMESGYEMATRLMVGEAFGAILCGNDQIAYGVWRRCRELRLGVPGQLLLYGFDDNPLNEWLAPWLSTVRVPHRRFAAEALRVMEADREEARGAEIVLPYEMITRS